MEAIQVNQTTFPVPAEPPAVRIQSVDLHPQRQIIPGRISSQKERLVRLLVCREWII
jgi:hypothetical protein